jgi:hypothetical protein
MILKKILRKPKDAILSVIMRKFAQKQLLGIGKIAALSLNSMEKKASVSLLLNGEKEKIRFDVLKFDILKDNGKYFFMAKEISSSREWIDAAAHKILVERKIEIPERLALWIRY